MSKYPNAINSLIAYLRKFPGVGSKTAERHAFQLLDWPDTQVQDFAKLLSTFKATIHPCPECGCLLEDTLCVFCDPSKRDLSMLCIIASAKDAYPIEETRVYKGLYHVIGGLLSPLDGKIFISKNLKIELVKTQLKTSSLPLIQQSKEMRQLFI